MIVMLYKLCRSSLCVHLHPSEIYNAQIILTLQSNNTSWHISRKDNKQTTSRDEKKPWGKNYVRTMLLENPSARPGNQTPPEPETARRTHTTMPSIQCCASLTFKNFNLISLRLNTFWTFLKLFLKIQRKFEIWVVGLGIDVY